MFNRFYGFYNSFFAPKPKGDITTFPKEILGAIFSYDPTNTQVRLVSKQFKDAMDYQDKLALESAKHFLSFVIQISTLKELHLFIQRFRTTPYYASLLKKLESNTLTDDEILCFAIAVQEPYEHEIFLKEKISSIILNSEKNFPSYLIDSFKQMLDAFEKNSEYLGFRLAMFDVKKPNEGLPLTYYLFAKSLRFKNETNFRHSEFEGLSAPCANFPDADFGLKKLSKTDFSFANLAGADFSRVKIDRPCDWRFADLRGAILYNNQDAYARGIRDLGMINFHRADLDGAQLLHPVNMNELLISDALDKIQSYLPKPPQRQLLLPQYTQNMLQSHMLISRNSTTVLKLPKERQLAYLKKAALHSIYDKEIIVQHKHVKSLLSFFYNPDNNNATLLKEDAWYLLDARINQLEEMENRKKLGPARA